ncbi:suppressor of fused domain protein [Bacillus sonorensis]|uniref:suppressor of fused domain protein n=1 Tax=Bacillus sonorensis TaxID=119858 RepID=UPI0018CDB87E|nr:suppressor of fused domain protein [Bacillus sonorensis]MBG9917225.1 hypothetical protein [Bacillus sonorensis]MCF7618759.1 suppressor of fused domain protein [Bacillus sonorensis]MCY8031989.1 suppressor of fused domain protein [Bacillus sonorensis]MCY8270845.1 suppressor of fused domain protein [Bacillus sonorensis]MCY8405761.1 suppressor of fused domain protein [Bacillus sonorensis]
MGVSTENKVIAKTLLKAFGGKPKVTKYWADHHHSSIDILSVDDRPEEGIISFATLGLSDYSIDYEVNGKPLRIEILGAIDSSSEIFANVLSTCAFNVINSNFSCALGAIFRDVIKMYDSNTEMEHVLFVSPFLWEDDLESLEFANKNVTWLLAVPISEEEYLFARENGSEMLEELLEKQQIDIFDIKRKSVI